jgi:hypothetical protein
MKLFEHRFGGLVTGILSGFDRLVFRGALRNLSHENGVVGLLLAENVRFVDFAAYVQRQTKTLIGASLAAALELGRPVRYVASSRQSKEAIAEAIARQDSIDEGLICVLKCVEPCYSFELVRDREKKKASIKPRKRKCLFLYHYWMDPQMGLMNARIQTWLPYRIQVCLNGRRWAARTLERAGAAFEQEANCIAWVEDFAAAQRLLDEQLKTDWPAMLETIARRLNPAHDSMLGSARRYYWSTYQSEWASDIVFDSPRRLGELFPKWLRGATAAFGAESVMRYLRDVPLAPNFRGRIVSDRRRRVEGLRLKHWVGRNSIKIYDKTPTVLRVETTVDEPRAFKSFRTKEGDPDGPKTWRPMRSGVADLHRRAEVSQSANDRYLDALATLDTSQTLGELLDQVSGPARLNRQRVRALRPCSADDTALLRVLGRAEWTINGFRNRDLRSRLHPKAPSADRRLTARITRQLRLLRAHGLIRKIPHTHRYRPTEKGRRLASAFLQARTVAVETLTELAA